MILCSGAFDGLHAGQVRYLQAAKRLAPGTDLVVAIAPDSYIRAAKHREPYWGQAERAHVVYALSCVDDVYLQTTDSMAQAILALKPDLVVKGPDWQDRMPMDVQAAIDEVGARLVYVQTPGRHTSEARR